jgi:hypothetical protein
MTQQIVIPTHQPEAIGPLSQHEVVSAVRLSIVLTAEIDAWAGEHEISRAEAIQRLVELGLRMKA